MNWFKEVIVDIIALIAIVAYSLFDNQYVEYTLWAYTGLIILAKVLAFFMPFIQKKASGSTAPNWFFHIIYALSVTILFYAQDFLMTVAWVVIWILSFVIQRKSITTPKK